MNVGQLPCTPPIRELQALAKSIENPDKETLRCLWVILGYHLSKLEVIPGRIVTPQNNSSTWATTALLELLKGE